METVFTLLLALFLTLLLYGYFNDRKLGYLSPEATQTFSPARLTPEGALAAAKALASNPVVMKNFLPPKTGRYYIIVGGAGFLGGWIVLQLLERGEDPKRIRILDIHPPTRPDLRTGVAREVSFLQVDITDAIAVSDAFKAPWPVEEDDGEITVFHTAANIRFYERDARLLPRSSKVNHDGTINVINASKEIGASTLIYTSSGCVSVRRSRFWLWPWEGQPPLFVQVCGDGDNHLPKRHDHFCSNYAVSKIRAEMEVRAADKSPASKGHVLRTGCIRPANSVFGPGGELTCGGYLVRKHNLMCMPNALQSLTYVENGALAHLCYEQRLIELERGSTNPDIGGQAFTIMDAGPPTTHGDVCTAITALDKEVTIWYLSPTLLLALSQVVEVLYLSKSLLSISGSLIGHTIAGLIPTLSGGVISLQPSAFTLALVHIIFDDSRARLAPSKGGLGYHGPYTTLEGVCKTVDEHFKSDKRKEERS